MFIKLFIQLIFFSHLKVIVNKDNIWKDLDVSQTLQIDTEAINGVVISPTIILANIALIP